MRRADFALHASRYALNALADGVSEEDRVFAVQVLTALLPLVRLEQLQTEVVQGLLKLARLVPPLRLPDLRCAIAKVDSSGGVCGVLDELEGARRAALERMRGVAVAPSDGGLASRTSTSRSCGGRSAEARGVSSPRRRARPGLLHLRSSAKSEG